MGIDWNCFDDAKEEYLEDEMDEQEATDTALAE